MRQGLMVVSRSVLLALVLLAPVFAHAAPRDAEVRAPVGALRLPFIANRGQVDGQVAYYVPGYDGTFFVTERGQLVYSLPPRLPSSSSSGWTVTETLVGGRPRPAAHEPSGVGVSYFVGHDPAGWRLNAPSYEQVGLGEVWPGVEVTLRARRRGVEKVFTVAPGASVNRIRIRVSGARAFSVSAEGALVASTGVGDITFTTPVAYQERDGARRPVRVAYRPGGREYGFTVGDYDPRWPLVIDPRLQSTYLGSSGEDAASALGIRSTTGDVYVAGWTTSTSFPGTAGGAQSTKSGGRDAFVARLNSGLTALLQATFFGGSGDDGANALAINPTTDDVYVAGWTTSTNLPGTPGGAQPTSGGNGDAFVARLNSSLTSLLQATYLGNSSTDTAAALAIHPTSGDVYVGGSRSTVPGCGGNTGFVARLNAGLTTLTQASIGNGVVRALALHPITNEILVAGSADTGFIVCSVRAFVKSLNASLTVTASHDFGSGEFGEFSSANALAIDPDTGDVYAAGAADPDSIPGTVGGAQSTCTLLCAFVVRLTSNLTSLIQATFLGNSFHSGDGANALAIDPDTGDVYVAGTTTDPAFPGRAGGLQPTLAGDRDAFIARLTNSLAALFQATYLGGNGLDIASALTIHPATGDVYVAGSTSQVIFPNFPGTAGGAQVFSGGGSDAFIALLTPTLAAVDPPVGPDLTLNKAHPGDFLKGHTAAYTITVSNVGTAATAGTVTVTDTLPAPLVATALDGPGWACTLGTLTCTRGDALGEGDTYPPITLTVTVPASAPASVINTANVSGGGDVNAANNLATDPTTLSSFFADIASDNPFSPWIDALFASGITEGCGTNPPRFCPFVPVTRGEMAVFLLRGIHGAAHVPPPPAGIFLDVSVLETPFADWIEELFNEGITTGCNLSPRLYCPIQHVTRAEMAVFILRAMHGAAFVPPPATGIFADVPLAHPLVNWIEELFNEGITAGCGTGPARYCPDDEITRAEMAVFLVRAFGLPVGP